jgi:hypothetical protein
MKEDIEPKKKEQTKTKDIFKNYKVGEVINLYDGIYNIPQLIISHSDYNTNPNRPKNYLLTTNIHRTIYENSVFDKKEFDKIYITTDEKDQNLITDDKNIAKIKSNETINSQMLGSRKETKTIYINPKTYNKRWFSEQGYGGQYTISKNIDENRKIIRTAWLEQRGLNIVPFPIDLWK